MNEDEQTALALTAGNGGTFNHVETTGWIGQNGTNTYSTTIKLISSQEIKLRQLAIEYAVRALPFDSPSDVEQIDGLINYFYNFLRTGSTVQKAEPATIDNF